MGEGESAEEITASISRSVRGFSFELIDLIFEKRDDHKRRSGKALGPQGTVERLYVRIVGRLSRPLEVDPHLVVIRPQIHDPTGELRPVITEQELWKPSRQPNLIQGRHHVFAL